MRILKMNQDVKTEKETNTGPKQNILKKNVTLNINIYVRFMYISMY